jgi:hypothetical protein
MRIRLGLALLLVCALPSNAATISGFVYGADNGEALPYTNVYLKNTTRGDVTNDKGFYVITGIPAGNFEITFSFMGYRQEIRPVSLREADEITLSLELKPQALQLDEVEISGSRNQPEIESSRLSLRTRELVRVPVLVEADLFRAVATLPGVSTLSEFSSGLYVRGGSPDQNLILLDDIDVYNPNHLFGFFSTFNVDAVKTVDLQKSGYPARYGGRLSSLLDVQNRDGNRKKFAGVGRIGLIASSVTLEGPWSRGSWMVSGRRTYIEQLARRAGIDLPYHFYDLDGKVNHDLAQGDRATLSYYRGRDRLNWDRDALNLILDWGNQAWSTRWTHLFSPRLFSQFMIGRTTFDSRAEVAFRDFTFRMKNEIEDISLKGDLTHTPSPSRRIDFGFETKFLRFGYTNETGEEDHLGFHYQGVYSALYGQENWKASEIWQLQGGLRLNYYSKGDYFRLDPRLSFRRSLNEVTALKLTYGRYHQFLNLVSQEGASFADMWFPVDQTLAPGRADHYIIGVEYKPQEAYNLSLEGYYKPYNNLVEFSEEFGRSLVEPDARLNQVFNSGTGRAYGLDAYVQNRYAGCEGWIGYSFGNTRRTIRQYNMGRGFYPTYDRRHQFYLMEERGLTRCLRVNATFHYGSGQPTTLADGRYTVYDITGRAYDVVLPGEKNADRLPAYHRLDLSLLYRREFHSWNLEPSLQIINVYNRKNIYVRSYDLTRNPAEFQDVTMFPFLPTLTVTASF